MSMAGIVVTFRRLVLVGSFGSLAACGGAGDGGGNGVNDGGTAGEGRAGGAGGLGGVDGSSGEQGGPLGGAGGRGGAGVSSGAGGHDGQAGGAGKAGAGGGAAGQGGSGEPGGQAGASTGTGECVLPEAPFAWPVEPEPVEVPEHPTWKTEVELPGDPFLYQPTSFTPDQVLWVKFLVLLRDPERVYFQDSNTYPLHYDFATERIPMFEGLSRREFDEVTLRSEGQEAVLGAVLVPSDASRHAEYAIQLVIEDPVHPELIRRIVDAVSEHVQVSAGMERLYFPNPAQSLCSGAHAAYFEEHGVDVSTVDRWLVGDACYSTGWAAGKLVALGSEEVDAAYLDGRLRPEDILLLTDSAPAELPYVAGILTLMPSTPNSHPAILARSYAVPFAYVRRPEAVALAEDLVGRQVVVSTSVDASSGDCSVRFIDVTALEPAQRAEILGLAVDPVLQYAAKEAVGAIHLPTEDLLPSDIDQVGGKAAHFGLLRRAAPDQTPTPAFAFTFDLWDAFMAQPAPEEEAATLGAEIARRLAPYAWPPDLAVLDEELDDIRDLVRGAPFPETLAEEVFSALADFEPDRRIRFRSSTNVEDSESFTGAGLYDSVTGCMADDQDDDEVGPSLCNPDETDEHGVLRAIRRVFASFYGRNPFVERLRRGVDEREVGMAMLVHYSVPDDQELANGVAVLNRDGAESSTALLVTQTGATSVTNPDGTALPEEVRISRYGTEAFLEDLQGSSLLPLGAHVLEWEDEYRTLLGLFDRTADEYSAATNREPPFALDFEYKKVTPGDLSLRQVRPLPLPDTTVDVTPFLVYEPTTLCVYPSEQPDVFALHRLKSELSLTTSSHAITPATLADRLYTEASLRAVSEGSVQTLAGDPHGFAGASHAATDTNPSEVSDSWEVPQGRWTLTTEVATLVARNECPVLTPHDFSFRLAAEWGSPMPYLEWAEGPFVPATRTTDAVTLWTTCPETSVLEPGSIEVEKSFTGPAGVTVTTSYWFPPPPRGFTAGYTAPVVKWEETTIQGLTSEPIVLRGYYSQTLRPYHHNFGGDYLFEPRLEEEIPAATLEELAAADVAYLVLIDDESDPDLVPIWIGGMDGALRQL